ncbi:MAG: hypothetical protein MUC65_10210, partial [Pontiellaceae bacterium]|nr:hypothetical protein [Pontiellaceae bacterium]
MGKKIRLKRALRKPGLTPGTLTVDPSWPKPVIKIIAYGPDQHLEKQITDLQEIDSLLNKYPVLWINIDGLGDEAVLRYFGQLFKLHPL